MKLARVRLGGAAWCVIAGALPLQVLAGNTATETVPPRAVQTWAEIVAASARATQSADRHSWVIDRQQMPGPQSVRAPEGDQPVSITHPSTAGPSGETNSTTQEMSTVASPVLDFDALLDNGKVIPPDTHGSIGPAHLMTTLNSQVRIQNKTGSVMSTVTLNAFWGSLGGNCFDPRVHYDANHGRWITTCAANADSMASQVYFAISSTNDPTGTWTFYSFDAKAGVSDSSWADFPVFGFNAKWIAISANMFKVKGTAFNGSKMWVIDQASALAGGSLTFTVFPTLFDQAGGVRGFALTPCLTYGSTDTLYVVDNSNYYASSDTTFLVRLSRITGTGPSPVWSVAPGSPFTGSGLFRVVNNFSYNMPNALQKGSSIAIDAGDTRMMSAVFRNGKIWFVHSGSLPPKIAPASNRVASFWYQIDPATMPFPILQSGVIDGGAGVFHIFPSIAANALNDACVGFTRSDANRYAEAVYCGRRSGDAIGTMKPVQLIKAGESSYTKFFRGKENRWGDYSNTGVDPADDQTFWTIQEYAGTSVGSDSNSGRWATRWAKIDPASSFTTGVEAVATLPLQTDLDQNYPNPFNPTTSITYRLSTPGYVSLVVYDLLGRPVTELERGYRQAGSYQSTWNASRVASGAYYARFTVTDELGRLKFSKVNGMVMMK